MTAHDDAIEAMAEVMAQIYEDTLRQPMETAPKDAVEILAFDEDDDPYLVNWSGDAWSDGEGGPHSELTWWYPLPGSDHKRLWGAE